MFGWSLVVQVHNRRWQPYQTGVWLGREWGWEGHGLCLTFGRFCGEKYVRWIPDVARSWLVVE